MPFYCDVSGNAEEDVERQALYIAEHNVNAALKFMDCASLSFNFLTDNPYAGSVYKVVVPGVNEIRRWHVKEFTDYLIFYQVLVEENRLIIHRVLHGMRDIGSLLDDL